MAPLPATIDQFDKWEQMLERGNNGKPMAPYDAARAAGTTLTALRTADRERQAIGLQYSRERRAALVDEVMDAVVLGADATPTDRIAWAKANHEGYRDKSTLEITGTIEHTAKIVTLADMIAVMKESKGFEDELRELDEGPGRALPSPGDVLSAPAKREAGSLPPERQA